jgi:hypothetical protein
MQPDPKNSIGTRICFAVAALLASCSPVLAADPLVSNLTASQRAGTKLVDIRYDVTASTPMVKVTLEISSDGGTNWSTPLTTVPGAARKGVTAGTSETSTLNSGVGRGGKFCPQTRLQALVDDLRLPAIAGCSGISAGTHSRQVKARIPDSTGD